MASTDIFGQQKQLSQKKVLSTDFAALYLGSRQFGLAQSVRADYQRRVETRGELGTSEIIFVVGQSMGSVACGQIVGEGGFLPEIGDETDGCGEVRQLSFKMQNPGSCSTSVSNPSLLFDSSVLQTVSFSSDYGALHNGQNAQFICTNLRRGS